MSVMRNQTRHAARSVSLLDQAETKDKVVKKSEMNLHWPGARVRAWALCMGLLLAVSFAQVTVAQTTTAPAPVAPGQVAPAPVSAGQSALTPAQAAALVTEFDVNGLKVLVKRREGSQTVVAGLFIRGGSRNITAENAGVEALMLDLASEATVQFPRERMRTELSRMGTGISYGINYDYSALTLSATRANFDRSWEIFTDVALRPSFAPDDFARVRNRMVIGRRSDADIPDSYLQLLQSRAAYAGHPYLNDPGGTAETLGRLTLDDVKRYHQQVMQTSRLLLVVVGDLDPQALRQRIAASFGKLPRGDYKQQAPPQLSFSASTVEVTQRGLPTNYVQGVFAAPSLTAADIYPMRIASTILQSRVFVEVRVRRNLSYAPDAFLRSQGANVGGIYVTATDANQAVRVMLAEIERLQQERIEQEEINSIVQQYLTRHYLSQETNAAQAGELAQYELIGGGWRNSMDFLERLRAVTPADVQRVAKTYMRNIRFVVIGDPKSVDPTIFTGQTTGE
jgi:zinc protease